jgi:hypothetical protein
LLWLFGDRVSLCAQSGLDDELSILYFPKSLDDRLFSPEMGSRKLFFLPELAWNCDPLDLSSLHRLV